MADDLTDDLMAALGEDGFFALTEAYAGTRLYVPADPGRSDLVTVLGHDATAALSNLYRGAYISVPLAREFRALRYRFAGASNREIARHLGLTESGVSRLFRRAASAPPRPRGRQPDPRQIDLFDPGRPDTP